MIYYLGDKFLIDGLEFEVKFVNNGMAWLAPTEGNTHVASERLDEKGRNRKGVKAKPIVSTECLAV